MKKFYLITKHQKFGGVVPELASREHSDSISKLTKDVLKKSNLEIDSIGCLCCNNWSWIIRGALVGCNYAKGLAIITGKPFYQSITYKLTP